MKPFVFEKWQAWDGTAHLILSDETEKKLRYFKSTEDCINWLFLNSEKPAARALNSHVKGVQK